MFLKNITFLQHAFSAVEMWLCLVLEMGTETISLELLKLFHKYYRKDA